MKALKARITDMSVEVGTVLLPAVTKWLSRIREIATDLSKWISSHTKAVETLAGFTVKLGLASAAVYAFGAAVSTASKAITGMRLAVTFLSGHPIIALTTAIGAAVLATAHWAGVLEPVYKWLSKITSMAPDTTSEIDALNESMERTLTLQTKQAELQGRIAANRKTTGNPWGITADRARQSRP